MSKPMGTSGWGGHWAIIAEGLGLISNHGNDHLS